MGKWSNLTQIFQMGWKLKPPTSDVLDLPQFHTRGRPSSSPHSMTWHFFGAPGIPKYTFKCHCYRVEGRFLRKLSLEHGPDPQAPFILVFCGYLGSSWALLKCSMGNIFVVFLLCVFLVCWKDEVFKSLPGPTIQRTMARSFKQVNSAESYRGRICPFSFPPESFQLMRFDG